MTTTTDAPIGKPSFSEARARLKSAQKSSKGAAAYSRYVNRPLGRVFAAAAASLGLTPNVVTVISALFTFAGLALVVLAPPTVPTALAVTVALVVGYALDSADGQVARLRGGGSLAGEWLDHMVDALKTATIHLAVLISWFRFTSLPDGLLLVPLGFSAVAVVIFFGLILTDFLRRLHRGSSEMILVRPGRTSLLYSLAVLPFDYGLLCLSFLLFWWTPGFAVVYTALFAANLLVVPIVWARWLREMRRLDRA